MGIEVHPKINPYRIAASALFDRIKWDLNPEAFRSRSKINGYENKYKGKSAVIMCNGPSLLKTDFSLLKNSFVFGLNKINLLFEKTEFRPNAIVAVNKLVIEQNASFFNETDIPLFLDSTGTSYIRRRENIMFLKAADITRFARNVSMSIYQGYTVTYAAMQIAFHMGFSKVTLIGCDHNFSAKGIANATVMAGAHDDSHFDPRYFADVKWQLPDLLQSEISYLMALDAFQMDGRLLCNSTEGGRLELLPRIQLSDFLSGSNV